MTSRNTQKEIDMPSPPRLCRRPAIARQLEQRIGREIAQRLRPLNR